MSGKIFKTTKERFGHPAGTLVKEYTGYDYGLARDDTAVTGIPHVSVVLADGSGTGSFTIPNGWLVDQNATEEEIKSMAIEPGVRALLEPWRKTVKPFIGFDCVWGIVKKTNGDFSPGQEIWTNKILSLEYDESNKVGKVVTASGSVYHLGARAED